MYPANAGRRFNYYYYYYYYHYPQTRAHAWCHFMLTNLSLDCLGHQSALLTSAILVVQG